MVPASPWMRDAASLPAEAGAYALWIELADVVPLPPRFGGALPGGTYVYLGSAAGPGGIRARCARHLASQKTVRWHVDWLTTRAGSMSVLPVPGGNECALVRILTGADAAVVPVPRFGSSDCRSCPAHLLRPVRDDAAALLTAVLRRGETGH